MATYYCGNCAHELVHIDGPLPTRCDMCGTAGQWKKEVIRYQMKASELVTSLQTLIAEHGDLPVFSRVDFDWVGSVEFLEGHTGGIADEKHFSLDWN